MNPLSAVVALAAGVLFGGGLSLSGMIDPAKVLGFLDIGGSWDPSLAGVMAGAIPVTALFYRWTRRRGATLAGQPVPAAPRGVIDARLIGGAAVFGLGWGLAGLCPGPAIADLALDGRVIPFVLAMAAGLWLARRPWRATAR
jgi:hypothetical protein